jgi:hypothetical protein
VANLEPRTRPRHEALDFNRETVAVRLELDFISARNI